MPFDHFNVIARIYDRAAAYQPSQTILELLDLPAPGFLLDAGGGTGRVAQAFRALGQAVLVVDPSLGMLRRAADKGLPAAYAPAEELPFRESAFGRIFMMDALHHVRDQKRTASELVRLLACGGKLVLVEPNIRLAGVKAIAFMEKMLLMRSHFLSRNDLAAIFQCLAAGTKVIEDENNLVVLVEK